MSIFRPASARQLNLALTIVRVAAGIAFAAHGGQKLFVFGFAGVTGMFANMGIPLPGLSAPLVILVEFLGGLALIFGLLTRPAAVALAIDMLGAIVLVHLKNGYFLPTGFEYPFLLLAASLALVIAGAGAFSADEVIASRQAELPR